MDLQILFQDDSFLAVHKPTGLHVHPSDFSRNEISLLELLQQEFDGWFAPAHRIDRATSGIVLFARNNQTARAMGELFAQRRVSKRYLALVRGYMPPVATITTGTLENNDISETSYKIIRQVELPVAINKHTTSRYSLADINPLTGRRHQIRKHFSSISHPIIGDVRYGDGRHNLFFREQFGLQRLLLFALELRFQHPFTDEEIIIKTRIEDDVRQVFEQFGWSGNW